MTPRRQSDMLVDPNLAELEPLIRSVFPAVANEHEIFYLLKLLALRN